MPASPPSVLDTVFTELRLSMLTARAKFDDLPVTDLRRTGRCEATFVTTRGATPVRWKDLGALIVRLQNGRTLFRIPAADRVHVLSAPTGRGATDINVGLGMFDEECGGV